MGFSLSGLNFVQTKSDRLKPVLLMRFRRGELRMAFYKPCRDRAVQLRKMSREEMIPAGNNLYRCIFPDMRRKLLDHRAKLYRWAEAIEFAGDQKLWLIAVIEIREAAVIQIADWKAESDEFGHARVAAPGAQSDPGTKTESRDEKRHSGEFRRENIQHG
jgi:hypothetical protein